MIQAHRVGPTRVRAVSAVAMAVCLAMNLLPQAIAHGQRVHVYHAARIWTGKGAPVQNGTLIVKGSKIVAVGTRGKLTVPAGAVITDFGQRVLIPGLVVAETNLAEPGRDELRSITPSVQAIEGFDFFKDYWKQLSGGVTTVQIAPGSSRLMPGRGSVVKLSGGKNRVLRTVESLRVVLSSASRKPPRIYRPPIGAVSVDRPLRQTRPQVGGTLSDAVAGLRLVFRSASRYRANVNDTFETQFMLLSLNNLQRQRGVVRVTAQRSVEVQAALNLSREFRFPLLLVGPQNVDAIVNSPAIWKSRLHGVILRPPHRPGVITNTPVPSPTSRQPTSPLDYAAKLHRLGIPVAIKPQADADLHELLFLAGSFVGPDLDAAAVLAMVTSIPAKMLGVSERVGELATGRDADFVVLSADPFSVRSQVHSTYVGGARVYDSEVRDVTTVVRAGRIYTEQGIVSKGAIVVRGDTIRNVGQDVSAPLNANVRRYPNGVVVPGFIDLGSALGGSVSGRLGTKLSGKLNSNDPAIKVARQGGVTTVLRAAGTTAAPVIAFKLGSKVRVIQDPVAIKFTVSGNLTLTIPSLRNTLKRGKDYHTQWLKYEAQLPEYNKQLKAYEVEKAKFDAAQKKVTTPSGAKGAAKKQPAKKEATKKPAKKPTTKPTEPKKPKAPTKPKSQASLEPYRSLFTGKIPALVEARQSHTITAALKLFRDEYQIRTVLIGGDALSRIPDFVAKKNVSVAVGPNLVPTVDRKPANLAQILANRQVPFAFQSNATTGVSTLPLAVRYAVRKGLGKADALSGLTTTPAKLVSIDKRVGSLKAGKDADLVVLSGPPFELSTRVLAVMIDGRWVYEREKQK